MNDTQALELLRTLVSMPSVSGNEQMVAEYLVRTMSSWGFAAHIDAVGNAIGSIGTGPETVVLLGHMDTVPGHIPVRIVDGALWGRGSVDAKGALATFIAAAARAAASGRLQRRVVIAGCVEEEVASSKGAQHLAQTWAAPDWCVIGEPSGAERVTLGYKGNLRLALQVELAAAHSAHAEASAAERGCAIWQALSAHAQAYNHGLERAFDHVLPSLVAINSASDGLVQRCELLVNVRLPLALPPAAYLAAIQELELLRAVEMQVSGATPAFVTERTSPLVRRFSRVLRSVGAQPRLVLKTGTADMNVVGPAWGCPIVAYGPGDAALDHTPEERIALDEYWRGICVLEHVLLGQ